MSSVFIIVIVDVEGALSSNDLNSNVYAVDSVGYMGTYGEGTSDLSSKVSSGQIVQWSIVPVQPNGVVSISGFGGPAVDQGVITPCQEVGGSYGSEFKSVADSGTQYQYVVVLDFEGRIMKFDLFLVVA